MSFRFKGLHADPFSDLFALSDAALAAKGFVRMIADEKPGFPCRVSLADAELGEEVLLANFEHQQVHSPYRATGPIFVRRNAKVFDSTDVPQALRPRLLSLRAYDDSGMMVEADVVEGIEVETLLARLFTRDDVSYVHVHYAKRGCFAVRVERAEM